MTAMTTHPLVDASGAGWAATELQSPVVALTPAMSDFLQRAAGAGVRPLLITAPHTRMTTPLQEALRLTGGHWVVRADQDRFYAARDGAVLAHPADVLVHPKDAPPRQTAAEFARSALSTRLRIVASFSTRHRVAREIVLGGTAETLTTALTGVEPIAWGATEPVVAPWNRAQLTEFSRRRVPADSRWIVVGEDAARVVGTIAVARTTEGIEETTHISVDRGTAGDPRHESIAHDAIAALSAGAAHGMPLLGVAFAKIGAADLSARSTSEPPPQPLALLVGPPALRRLGVDVKTWAAGLGATTIGRPRLPSVIVPLGDAHGGGWERVRDVLTSIDADAAVEALGLTAWLPGGGSTHA